MKKSCWVDQSQCCPNIMAISWLLYLILIGFIIGFTTFAILYKKKTRVQDSSSTQQKYLYTQGAHPINRSNGWQLLDISHSVRVWQRAVTDGISWIPGTIYGSYVVIPSSLQDVMGALRDPNILLEWDSNIQRVSQVTLGDDHDVLSVLPQKRTMLQQVVTWLGELFGEDTNVVSSRYWQMTNDKEGWMFISSIQQSVFYNKARWTCFTVTSLVTDSKTPECVVSIIVCPSTSDIETICRGTCVKLAGLKDYLSCCRIRDLLPVQQERESEKSTTISATDKGSRKSINDNKTRKSTAVKGKYKGKQLEMKRAKILPSETRYQSEIEQTLNSLMAVYKAVEGVDNWVLVGNIRGVHILKRPAQPGEKPWECFKGTTTINVPIHYVLAYAFSLDARGEYDDMYNTGQVIEEFDPLTKVSRMEFKPVWPSTARDFCNLGAVRGIGEDLYGIASQSVEHDDCQEMKGFVRAELLKAGFVVKELSSDPPSCQVTYISQADLKGNLPVRIVNRVSQSQPQNLAAFRDKLEARYAEDMRAPADEMQKFQKRAVDLWIELMQLKEQKRQGGVSSEDKDSAIAESDASDLLSATAVGQEEEGSTGSETSGCSRNDSDFEDSFDALEVTDDNMKLPLVDRHQIDYRTLGNQAAATLLGELVLASKIEISLATTETPQQSDKEGEWSFQMVEKDVVILKKFSPGEKVQCFLGKGLIKASPLTVWQAITNHMTRYVYDKTLKKIRLVKQIDEQTKILYQHHEAAQCFVKQARDFVILAVERTESERYVAAGVSVDCPDCPPQKGLIRAKILASGWVVEPALQNGQLHSMVTYLSQVQFGGNVPIRLVNYVARRQPLCIAYLRDYLETFDER